MIRIYTDGSCEPNPGPGGWAAVIYLGLDEKVITGSEMETTNNRMELKAALEALLTVEPSSTIELFTDSEYLKRGITEWMPTWKARNWKRKKGKLANVDLWKALDAALGKHTVEWMWVKGHAGHPGNERADRLARRAMKR
ncbi:MAG: ribonuclease HI [Anaerolineales bacterium]|uniref:Ribonuclease H n=1 Tax=Candidatus Desulfolinea nitratireducens TaxID=2841698 RepID=A0A8J6NJF5_9CHLR|nr:ribonuclease HI [Candidatus Desulfolinea nitratireducens]